MKTRTKITGVGLAAVLGVFALTGAACASDADKASENISTAAEAFEVQRTLVATNGITGQVMLFAEGRCSFEHPSKIRIDITCKYGPDEYRRHTYIKGDQDQVVISQEESIDVSEYHSRIVIKPQNVIPEFDIMVGEDE
jgi:hypothetical protein